MKRFLKGFLMRGMVAAGFGPMALVVFYLITAHHGGVQTRSVDEVCTAILSLTALAFIAGGMNAIYQMERLPLMVAILIHGVVLYVGYLCTYLLNDWLDFGVIPIVVFSVIFVVGYMVIWAIIYGIIKWNTRKLNAALKNSAQ